MDLKNKKIGFIITDVFYAIDSIIPKIKELVKLGCEVVPIISFNNISEKSDIIINKIKNITNKNIILNAEEADLIGPKKLTDILVIAPCSGTTISKLALDITDDTATIAVKSHLRNDLPVVIAPTTNNGLSR